MNKNKHTTAEPTPRTAEPSVASIPVSDEFHQYLRAQIREATRTVMEEIMREELTQFVGADWGTCTPERNILV